MAHSNSHPYPLPFPNEDQPVRISSYSSLANALGNDPGYATPQSSRLCPTRRDAICNTQAIYVNAPPVGNALYPYPVRNALNPGTYPARESSVANARCSSDANVVQRKSGIQNELSQYDRLPQPISVEHQSKPEFASIQFSRGENKQPYSLWDLLTMDTMPNLVAGDAPILVQSSERWIKVRLNWPGYSRYPFEKRISIKRGHPLTRTLLLVILARHIDEFVRWIQKESAVVEPGQERWTITGVSNGAPATWKYCVVTSLHHLTGSVWQPEIYYPRR